LDERERREGEKERKKRDSERRERKEREKRNKRKREEREKRERERRRRERERREIERQRERTREKEREVVGGQKERFFAYRNVIQITSLLGQRGFGYFPTTDMCLRGRNTNYVPPSEKIGKSCKL
jgi:hypothetical protein